MSLVIPAVLWDAAITALRAPPHDRERVAYFDGPPAAGGVSVATTLTLPHGEESSGHFRVAAHEMSRAGRHLRHLSLMRLAQIHTHPAGWTGHSAFDDQMAFSQRDGAVSIVVPHLGGCAPGIGDCGVHVREPDGWLELDADARAEAIRIVPSLVDLRLP